MLHCPRCSGPLDVRQHLLEQQQQQQQQQMQQPQQQQGAAAAHKACPAGSQCPHQAAGAAAGPAAAAAPGWSFAATPGDKSVNYLSGGGIVVPGGSRGSSERLLQVQNLQLGAAAATATATTAPSVVSAAAAGQHHLHAPPVTATTTTSPAAAPMMMVLPQQQLVSPQPLVVSPGQCVQALQPQQQPQQHLQPVFQHPLLLPAPQLPGLHHHHQPQQQLVITTAGPVPHLHPQTPAIVVGASSPFFATTTQHQLLPAAPVLSPSQAQPVRVVLEQPQQPQPSLHQVLSRNKRLLEESGWFHPQLRWHDSAELLAQAAPGTFLVRESADPKFLFSLSVQRDRGDEGPTSVRIHFRDGRFRLDAEEAIRDAMPAFSSVVELMEHYLPDLHRGGGGERGTPDADGGAGGGDGGDGRQVWVDNVGQVSTPICLRRPLYRDVPSLAHFARLAVNKAVVEAASDGHPASDPAAVAAAAAGKLGLPKKLEEFVGQYPHRV